MRLFIGMPCYNRQVHSEVVENLFDVVVQAKDKKDHLSVSFPSSPWISQSRNLIMQNGLDYDWILMWDSDIQVPTPKFIYKMVETAYKQDAALVGLAVRLKLDSNEFACAKKVEGGYERYRELPKHPMEVDVMGAGVSLINSQWVKNHLDQPYYEFVEGKGVNGPTITPEDWRFSEKIKEKGGKIFVEPTIETIHWGIKGYHYEING